MWHLVGVLICHALSQEGSGTETILGLFNSTRRSQDLVQEQGNSWLFHFFLHRLPNSFRVRLYLTILPSFTSKMHANGSIASIIYQDVHQIRITFNWKHITFYYALFCGPSLFFSLSHFVRPITTSIYSFNYIYNAAHGFIYLYYVDILLTPSHYHNMWAINFL